MFLPTSSQQPAGASGEVAQLASWLTDSQDSPVRRFTPKGSDLDALFDIKVIYQQDYSTLNINDAPEIFRPHVGQFGLMNYEKVYTALPAENIFEQRQISREGAIVIVRPDMYVANVLPLSATDQLSEFFDSVLLDQN